MTKKWYNYFVSVGDRQAATPKAEPAPRSAPGAKDAAQRVADIASSIGPEPKFTTPVSDPTSFEEI